MLVRTDFIAHVVAWLRGTTYSKVLENPRDADLAGESARLETADGEELQLRELRVGEGSQAIGFRHDYPDAEGRLWRTEGVLRRDINGDGQDLLRVRTECVARQPGVRLDHPRKPYLIKSFLTDNWGGQDGILSVADAPIWLSDDSANLSIANASTQGSASRCLPVIYVSAIDSEKWLISRDQIKKLAFDLGGVAHVVVEPNRGFSFQLREATGGANVYGGTIAIAIPGRGILRRFYTGLRFPEVEDVVAAVRTSTLSIRTQMPAMGWDWTELQEQALRLQRERDRNRLSSLETEQLYQEEISNLQDRIRQLEVQIASQPQIPSSENDSDLLSSSLGEKVGPEIYPGEFTDRLRAAARESLARADVTGLDRRSKIVLDAIVARIPSSPALNELLEDLKRATKDAKHVASNLKSLLARHGYREKSENKHLRLEPLEGYDGLDSITVPKTPSESRGLQNLRKQIEGTLGISKLRD
jgi:hypothetical protein